MLPTLKVGDLLPAFTTEPVSRLNLALYCGASGDHNPIHVDLAFAQRSGMPDVFAHGMLSMAWLGRLLTHWVPQAQIRDFGVRFVAITQVGESITCSGRVTEVFEVDGERRARLLLQTANARGEVKLKGDAVVTLVHGEQPGAIEPGAGADRVGSVHAREMPTLGEPIIAGALERAYMAGHSGKAVLP